MSFLSMENSVDDTICAIATPVGEGGIGIIRVSGSRAVDVASRVVRPRHHASLQHLESHRLYVSDVIDARGSSVPEGRPEPDSVLDEALVVVMRKPRSYTGEDVVEIQAHGGAGILQATCQGLMHAGARLAQPGEFTKRAFLSGRLDLAQAEAVLDTIQATTTRSLQAAQSLLRGSLSKELETLRERLIRVLAHIEAGMDFAEEEIAGAPTHEVRQVLEDTQRALDRLIASYEEGRIIRDGIKMAIIGRPNVGKSSLLNALLQMERVIVSDQPGTTRDVIDEALNVGGLSLRLLDTAGLRRTQDKIEEEGIRRTEEAIADADVLLLVLDGSVGVTDEDRVIAETYGRRRYLLVLNKMDLAESRTLPAASLPPTNGAGVVNVSAKTGEGLDHLKTVIQRLFVTDEREAAPSVLVTRLRHHSNLTRTHGSLEEAMRSLQKGESWECIALDIRAALEALGEITGAVSTEDILDRIFRDFCVGK